MRTFCMMEYLTAYKGVITDITRFFIKFVKIKGKWGFSFHKIFHNGSRRLLSVSQKAFFFSIYRQLQHCAYMVKSISL